jgi:isoamylase/glycogen operon protein
MFKFKKVAFMNQSTPSPTLSSGLPYPFGNSASQDGINFAIYIKDAEKVSLCLFDENQPNTPLHEIELSPVNNRTGEVWHAFIQGLPDYVLYAYRVTLKNAPDKNILLLDPFCKSIASHSSWGALHTNEQSYQPLGKIVPKGYDWQDDRYPKIPTKDLIIYEMHVRGFTQDPSSGVAHPGTFSGITEKIPYLKSLGVNALEILPLFEFNECENLIVQPRTKEKLFNYFGYSTVNFFSPMNRYASQTMHDHARNEFRDMVKALHKNGIEIILDVVFNHSFEGNEKGPTLSFRGLDPHAYYMIDAEGNYLNFSGCGNTLNSNHPIVISLIVESLRYWVTEMHVDGFRFDLASIMTRAENGAPLPNAPLVEAISKDPILADTKLIAEAWDAGGLYQVGSFYPGKRWLEWNGKYRDIVRRFIKGTQGHKTAFATALSGSQDLYGWRESPSCSVNFITAHDGFSLADLVTYNQKQNLDNGEENRDGFDHNDSWNCGFEGHSSNKKVVFLRERQIRNFILALVISQGIPMIIMGDEYAHTRHGNNNTWCQDNALNWFLWDHLEIRPGFNRFFKSLINFRKNEPLLGRDYFLSDKDVSWHGTIPNQPEWEKDNGLVAFSLNTEQGPQLYVAFNASHIAITINIPPTNPGFSWYWVVNTHNPPPEDFFELEQRKKLEFNTIRIPSYSAYMLKAMPQVR